MAATREIPCSNCGAPLKYDPGALTLVCEHCGTENDLPPEAPGEAAPVEELDYAAAFAEGLDRAGIEESATIPCPGCGAEITFDADTIAEECPFCATPLAKERAHPHRHPKPQGVLPFAITERDARTRMGSWLSGLWFAPSGLKEYARAGRPMAGVYLPHYTYDARGSADYRGMRGDAYYVTQMVTVVEKGKTRTVPRQVRKIRWSHASGHVRETFDDVLVAASGTLGDQARGPEIGARSWDLVGLEPYRTEYLAGFRAEAPTLPLEDGFTQARAAMEDELRAAIRADIGGDEQRITQMAARFERITFKHVLLPVWLAAYRYRNRPYRVVINGRTGAVTGERPWSAVKIAVAVVIALAVLAGVGWLMTLGR